MDILKNTQQFFDSNVEKYGDSLHALDWGSTRTQQLRFYILSEIANLHNRSVLDVGCGFGDFFTFLNTTLQLNIAYTGVDISKEVIQQARKKHPSLDVRQCNILQEDLGRYDYVFGSGIHNIKSQDNYTLFNTMLQKMYHIAKEGVATNMIDAAFQADLAEHIFAYEKNRVLAMAKELTPYIVLREDYLPHDFTLYLYKKDWAQRNNYV
jgi:ubiquinone/menaquinone biosynthesis C-methylase UbiE